MSWAGNPNNPVPNIGNVKSDLSQKIAQDSNVLSEKLHDVNRAQQVRRDTDKQKNNIVRLIDVDTAIMRQLEKFQLTVIDDGNRIKVPIFYSSPERGSAMQNLGARDYSGKLILPAIVFQRTTVEKDQSMMMFNRYLNYTVLRQYSEKNRYTRFSALVNQNVPVHEVYDVLMPKHMVFTYHFIIWTEYIEQINDLVERFNYEVEDYWGDIRGLKFRVKIDTFSHAIDLQVDQDRMVKTEFDLLVYGYLLPDIVTKMQGTKSTTQKWFIPKKIVMGVEVVSTGFDWNSYKDNKDKWRSQKYPNLPSDEVAAIIPPPQSFQDVTPIEKITPKNAIIRNVHQVIQEAIQGTIPFHFPPPISSNDFGQEKWVSYDHDYYYVYTQGAWKRVPIALFNDSTNF